MLAQTQTNIDNQAMNDYLDAFLKERLSEYIADCVKINEIRLKELLVIERLIRVEKELRNLRVLEAER